MVLVKQSFALQYICACVCVWGGGLLLLLLAGRTTIYYDVYMAAIGGDLGPLCVFVARFVLHVGRNLTTFVVFLLLYFFGARLFVVLSIRGYVLV